MAIILKTGKEHTDESGNTYSSAYGVIDWILTDKGDEKNHSIQLKIYKDSAARTSGKKPVSILRYNCYDVPDFDTYFSAAAITADDNSYKQSYIYLLQLKDKDDNVIYTNWKSDE